MLKRFLGFTAATLALTGAAAAQDWKPMTFSDLLQPSAATPQMVEIWGDLINSNNRYFRETLKEERFMKGNAPAQFLSHTFTDGASQITVSLISIMRECDTGANSFSSTDLHSICPVRVTVTGPQGVKTTRSKGCFLYAYQDVPDAPDPRTNATFVAYDAKQGVVTVRALRDGRPVRDCTTTIKIR